jgi:hypothetical protein
MNVAAGSDGFAPPPSEAWRANVTAPSACPCCGGELARGYIVAPLTVTWFAGDPPGFWSLGARKGHAVGGDNRPFRSSRPQAWRCIVCGSVVVPPQPP